MYVYIPAFLISVQDRGDELHLRQLYLGERATRTCRLESWAASACLAL
jgi:hypothetical protein